MVIVEELEPDWNDLIEPSESPNKRSRSARKSWDRKIPKVQTRRDGYLVGSSAPLFAESVSAISVSV